MSFLASFGWLNVRSPLHTHGDVTLHWWHTGAISCQSITSDFYPGLLIGYSQLTSIPRSRYSHIRNLGTRCMGVYLHHNNNIYIILNHQSKEPPIHPIIYLSISIIIILIHAIIIIILLNLNLGVSLKVYYF